MNIIFVEINISYFIMLQDVILTKFPVKNLVDTRSTLGAEDRKAGDLVDCCSDLAAGLFGSCVPGPGSAWNS